MSTDYVRRIFNAMHLMPFTDSDHKLRELARLHVSPDTWIDMVRDDLFGAYTGTPVVGADGTFRYFGFGVDFDDTLERNEIILRIEVHA